MVKKWTWVAPSFLRYLEGFRLDKKLLFVIVSCSWEKSWPKSIMAGCVDCSFDPVIPTRIVRIVRVWISGAWVFEFINRCQIWFFEYLRISELLLLLVVISKPSKNWQFSSENWKRTHSWLFSKSSKNWQFSSENWKRKGVSKSGYLICFSSFLRIIIEEPPW